MSDWNNEGALPLIMGIDIPIVKSFASNLPISTTGDILSFKNEELKIREIKCVFAIGSPSSGTYYQALNSEP